MTKRGEVETQPDMMVPDDVCRACGAPLDAVGGCLGTCDPADPKFYPEDEW